jgi:hypothetical protein
MAQGQRQLRQRELRRGSQPVQRPDRRTRFQEPVRAGPVAHPRPVDRAFTASIKGGEFDPENTRKIFGAGQPRNRAARAVERTVRSSSLARASPWCGTPPPGTTPATSLRKPRHGGLGELVEGPAPASWGSVADHTVFLHGAPRLAMSTVLATATCEDPAASYVHSHPARDAAVTVTETVRSAPSATLSGTISRWSKV